MEIIGLNDVLRLMDQGETFSIKFVTCDRIRKTGGRIVYIHRAKKIITDKAERYSTAKDGRTVLSRNPDHFKNFTRNIYDLGAERKIKIHPRLIIFFNGKRVRY